MTVNFPSRGGDFLLYPLMILGQCICDVSNSANRKKDNDDSNYQLLNLTVLLKRHFYREKNYLKHIIHKLFKAGNIFHLTSTQIELTLIHVTIQVSSQNLKTNSKKIMYNSGVQMGGIFKTKIRGGKSRATFLQRRFQKMYGGD
jgi:hypothetical protein